MPAIPTLIKRHDVVKRTWSLELEGTGLKRGTINFHMYEFENVVKLVEFWGWGKARG